MASGKLLRQLIKYGASGNVEAFRAAAEAAIQEERQKKHHLLANDLERLLYGERMALDSRISRKPFPFEPPKANDGELPLVEERPVIREEKDIILTKETRKALEIILREHNRADILKAHGLQPSQKLLFFGPPGCGKTLGAEVIANTLSLPLILVRLDSLISSFLGETAANLRRVFDFISKVPVVALFDEFDALVKDRGDSADHGELKRAVNAVLQMMDGYRGESIIIATTNYETLLDKAIWRRFDETVFFGMPDEKQIADLLALKLSGVRHNFETDDSLIVSMFKGFSHADIERILRRAVKEMILSGREFLEIKHLKDALSREHSMVKTFSE